ncbi:MAG: CRISPR-associated helicase Cas3' [Candidatus Sumerlaeaceae bacterium]|nr:CRISPR-associated helicase Cas3' [Candidatus Sumerlaeaceae bacterium]
MGEFFVPLYAHTGTGGPESGTWHGLEKHLRAVADLSARFGENFGAGPACRVLGLAHDLGKANPAFQEYLRACAENRSTRSVPHSAAGASVVKDLLKTLTVAILGHHAGLPDAGDVKTALQHAQPEAIEASKALWAQLYENHNQALELPDWVLKDPLAAEMFIRMCFSALVDADFLDTEAHFNPSVSAARGGYPPLQWYCNQLADHMDHLTSNSPDTRVNRTREQILAFCKNAALKDPGAFRLTVPTGGGKTLSGLSFAFHHAVHHGMSRVIFAIPYTSIIDQTASVCERIFGAENLLEHHSAVEVDDSDEGQSLRDYQRRLAAENWDCPLVLSTTVQLFESMLSNRPSRCRKLHNIARSVIILDEIQALPPNLLLAVLDMLSELVIHYGCTVVFCTATQPDYSQIPDRFGFLGTACEIVENPDRYFLNLKRVDYEFIGGKSHEAVAEIVKQHEQVLCVVNTRRDALRILNLCHGADSLFHLSTLMCPLHRKHCLEEVRYRLRKGLPVRLVSTQVVEAGVDLDFPVVMRDIGPLDRIVQVAGRCNREGTMPTRGQCLIFRLESGGSLQGPYRTGIELARRFVEEYPNTIDSPAVISSYFRSLFQHTHLDRVRVEGRELSVQDIRRALNFATLGRVFRFIPETTVPLVTRYRMENVDVLLKTAIHQLGPRWARRLGPYMVTVYKHEFDRMLRDGLVSTDGTGIYIYNGCYSELFGIDMLNQPDPADLVF